MGEERMRTTRHSDGLGWPEGPALLPDGSVVFVETYRGRVSRWTEGGGVTEYAFVGGGPNAVVVAGDGALFLTQNGGVVGAWRSEHRRPPSIQRIGPDGKVEIVATHIDGRTLSAPNDLAFGPDGRLYFTDPVGGYDPVGRPDPGYIFAMNPDGTGDVLVELPPTFPNGIAVEADGSVVWVESYTRAVRRRQAAGAVEQVCILPETTIPDGFKIAANGDFYVAGIANRGIDVVRPDGTFVETIPVGLCPTNCAFDGSTLYVTDAGPAGTPDRPGMAGSLWAVALDGVTGAVPFPGPVGRH
jgi:gluconolactonase